ncbi:MAG: hypothetical protein HY856_13490 [Burkholderiales bacterium]|nr:hypothetical protein [Burkholderiales bacterium]
MQQVDSPSPHTLARRTDPATSRDAASKVARFSGAHYRSIVEAMGQIASGGLIRVAGASEIAQQAGLDAYQVRKRLPELQRAGLVRLADGSQLTATGRRERLLELCA